MKRYRNYRRTARTAACDSRESRSVGRAADHSTRGKEPASRKIAAGSGRAWIFLATLFLIFLLWLGPLSRLIEARNSQAKSSGQLGEIQYEVIQIQSGDSLWSIAKDHMNPGFPDIYSYIKEIQECNSLETNQIISGNYLMIPYYEYEGAAAADGV